MLFNSPKTCRAPEPRQRDESRLYRLEAAIRANPISQRWTKVWKRDWQEFKQSWTSNPAQCKQCWMNNPARCKLERNDSIGSCALSDAAMAGFSGSFPASALSPLREARSFFSSSVLACSKRDRLSNRACSCKALEEAIRVILISQRWKEVWKRECRNCKKSWTSNPAQCKHGWTNNPARCKLRQKNWIRSEPLGEATLRKPETNLETPPSPRPIERKTIY